MDRTYCCIIHLVSPPCILERMDAILCCGVGFPVFFSRRCVLSSYKSVSSLFLPVSQTRHPWRSLLFVILASIWAGASRVNWFPVPAMLAIAIYLLETSFAGKGWRYWLTPFIWGISGLVAAIVSQFVYINISGNADIRTFGSSFTSDLIWNSTASQ